MSREPPNKKRKVVDAPEAVEAASKQITELTEELPSLPFAYRYRNGKFFYVRKCYEGYYELVKKMLDDGKPWVTVTGTPGIGKSVFYAYFFNRLREREPNTWIIAISFKRENIAEIAVYKGRGDPEEIDTDVTSETEAAIGKVLKEARANKKVLFLCDGRPTKIWRLNQMVVFTSPNEKWLRAVRKTYSTLFMPLWTFEELREAALLLSLAGPSGVKCISDDDLETRFNTFGGVARECLSVNEADVDLAKWDITEEVKMISDLDEFRNAFKGVPSRFYCHRLLHYVPVDESAMKRRTKLASPFVVELIGKSILASTINNRNMIRMLLDGVPEGASLAGWLFEASAHEALQGGCTLQLRLLENSDTTSKGREVQRELKEVEIAATEAPDVFKMNDLSPKTAKIGPYHKPELKQFESIDSFYLAQMNCDGTDDISTWNIKNDLILFQMTISETHPVNASGIIKVLEKLELLESVKNNPKRVALVFAVPHDIADSFKLQKIVHEEVSDSDPVFAIRGIGKTTTKKLEECSIYKISEPRAAIEMNTLPPKVVSSSALANLKCMRDSSYSDAMAKIPQYVWPLRIPDEAGGVCRRCGRQCACENCE
ncbi:hypothetical protein PF008_g15860 [Phytophthora fragariae]|uniref:Uncharacterized protein n=1 Tax=Phytophthora fragariae TaxID=53985 RepID=A0A6G0RCW5_9STRA|nr:hypothetical protein PF008_g15860 [Phytophthora fragariae]